MKRNRVQGPEYRGVLEGFYGPRWTHADRLALLDKMPAWRMNLYIYAARNDPYHRYGWAVPYPRDEMRRFAALAERAALRDAMLSIAISPGPDYDHTRKRHRDLLMRKLGQFVDLGCTLFPIFYDGADAPVDFNGPSGAAHAEKQAAVINGFLEKLSRQAPGARVMCCPSEFGSAEKSDYLCRLHARLDPRVMVMCTSVDKPDPGEVRTHCPLTWPKKFTNGGAERYARNFGRKPFLWDNFNCSDFSMNRLNWSPYSGRGDRLDALCAGIVLNPQHLALLNDPVFGTAGEFFGNPRAYHPGRAMDRSLAVCLGKEGARVGRILSKWYTSEWSGYSSRELNLPGLKAGLSGSRAGRLLLLRRIKIILEPVAGLERAFDRTLMPPDWACHLSAYVRLLTGWARAVEALCSAAHLEMPVSPEQAGAARARLKELRGADNRLPDSLLAYLEELVDGVSAGAVVK
jgi:hypothetical protein